MIAAWKRQTIGGMASTFAGASEVARANGEAEVLGALFRVEQRRGRGVVVLRGADSHILSHE